MKRTVSAALAAGLTLASVILVPAAAHADFELGNGCWFVEDPTPSVHTVCTGVTFDSSITPEWDGLNLDYAEFVDVTFTDPDPFQGVASARHLVFDRVVADRISEAHFDSINDSHINGFNWVESSGTISDSQITDTIFESDLSGATIRDTEVYSVSDSDLSGTTLENVDFGGLWQVDLTNAQASSVTISTLGAYHTDFTGSDFSGTWFGSDTTITFQYNTVVDADFSNTTWRDGSTILDSTFRNTSLANAELPYGPVWMTGLTFENVDFTNTMMMHNMHHASLRGADLRAARFPATVDYSGADLTDANLSGMTLTNWTLNGAQLLRTNLSGATFDGYFTAHGANFTSADLSGVSMLVDDHTGNTPTNGSVFAYTNLDGAQIRLGRGWIAPHVSAVGTYFEVGDWIGGQLFHHADLRGAQFIGSGANSEINGTQFHGADLTGAILDVKFEGAAFVDAVLDNAQLQPSGFRGMAGMVLLNSSARGLKLPAHDPDPDSGNKWMYGMWIDNVDITGSDFLPADFTVVADENGEAEVDWQPGHVWINDDGQSPYVGQNDGGYWWGARLDCTVLPGDTLTVGEHSVTCTVMFDNTTYIDDPTWSRTTFDLDDLTADPNGSLVGIWGVGATQAGFDTSVFTPTSTNAEINGAVLGTPVPGRNGVEGIFVSAPMFMYGWMYHPATTASITTHAAGTFNIAVETEPSWSGALSPLVVGQPVTSSPTVSGVPAPVVTAEGLPAGLEWVDGEITGTPEVGTRGWHTITLTASNGHGTAVWEEEVWVVEPLVIVDRRDIAEGDTVTLTGAGYTPNGRVSILLGSTALGEYDVEEDGTFDGFTHAFDEAGEFTFTVVDITTTASADTLPIVVAAAGGGSPIDDGDDDSTGAPGLSLTGVNTMPLLTLALLLMLLGIVGYCSARRA